MAKAAAVELPQASRWHSRVVRWAENIRRDLRADSVASPRGMESYWMLYIPKKAGATDTDTAGVACDFCKNCAAQFTRLRGSPESRRPAVRMPLFARANGLWGGPLPEELGVLTYAERRVIALARVYVSIKRVHPEGAPYIRDVSSGQPLYHERNVVAYPQTQEYVKQIVGMSPASLAQSLFVQFYGTDPTIIRREPALQVSVHRLRAAMQWLSVNSWDWMVATRSLGLGVAADGSIDLGPQIEEFLGEYRRSVGSDSGGVPAELLQCATPLQAKYAGTNAAGPADAVDREGGADAEGDVGATHLDADALLGGR